MHPPPARSGTILAPKTETAGAVAAPRRLTLAVVVTAGAFWQCLLATIGPPCLFAYHVFGLLCAYLGSTLVDGLTP